MGSARIANAQNPGPATPEAEVSALANVYRFVLDCHAKKEAAPESRPDAAKGPKHDSRPTQYTR
jgi:hypothetical protein